MCVPSQWETMLHCNAASHWLGAYTILSLDIFQMAFSNAFLCEETFCILIQIPQMFVPKDPIDNSSALVPKSDKAITWTNDDPVHWHIHHQATVSYHYQVNELHCTDCPYIMLQVINIHFFKHSPWYFFHNNLMLRFPQNLLHIRCLLEAHTKQTWATGDSS